MEPVAEISKIPRSNDIDSSFMKLCNIKEFPVKEKFYEEGLVNIIGKEIRSISVGPGRQDKLVALYDVAEGVGGVAELCKKAGNRQVTLWRGNTAHRAFLRYSFNND